ncbi:MAG: PilZ domain-containing protein [Planctomycetota bacterium]|nr:PilZ domain-containing protein [Planctomycetota bacterium]
MDNWQEKRRAVRLRVPKGRVTLVYPPAPDLKPPQWAVRSDIVPIKLVFGLEDISEGGMKVSCTVEESTPEILQEAARLMHVGAWVESELSIEGIVESFRALCEVRTCELQANGAILAVGLRFEGLDEIQKVQVRRYMMNLARLKVSGMTAARLPPAPATPPGGGPAGAHAAAPAGAGKAPVAAGAGRGRPSDIRPDAFGWSKPDAAARVGEGPGAAGDAPSSSPSPPVPTVSPAAPAPPPPKPSAPQAVPSSGPGAAVPVPGTPMFDARPAPEIPVTGRRARLGDLLVAEGKLRPEDLLRALAEARRSRERIGRVLVRMGLVTGYDIAVALGKQFGFPAVDIEKLVIQDEAFRAISPLMMHKYRAVPFATEKGRLKLAASYPLKEKDIAAIAEEAGKAVQVYMADEEYIAVLLRTKAAVGRTTTGSRAPRFRITLPVRFLVCDRDGSPIDEFPRDGVTIDVSESGLLIQGPAAGGLSPGTVPPENPKTMRVAITWRHAQIRALCGIVSVLPAEMGHFKYALRIESLPDEDGRLLKEMCISAGVSRSGF